MLFLGFLAKKIHKNGIVIFIIVQIYLILIGLIKRLGVEARVVPFYINYYVQLTKKKK